MAFVLAIILLGAVGSRIPTDADIAARIETTLRQQLHPSGIHVVVERRSALSTTFERVDITITGFTADAFPLGVQPAPAVVMAPIPGPAHRDGDTPVDPPGRQIRIKHAHLLCKDFTLKGLPIKEMDWDLNEVRMPWESAKAGKLDISSADSAIGYCLLREQGITRFVRTRNLPLDDPEVLFTTAGCQVKGTTQSFIQIPVEVSGQVVARQHAVLYLNDPKLHVSVLAVPHAITERVLKGINPLIDLNADLHLPVALTVTGVTHGNGTLRFDATLQFPPTEK
jgi:hypothetical protein